jgi:hypothetical protein
MNKEQQELLDKAYNNYFKKATPSTEGVIGSIWVNIAKNIEEFIDKCKTDTEFSKRWGLKIEERELSLEERCELGYKYVDSFEWDMLMGGGREGDEGNCNDYKIPTKLITVTYNDKTIESYESKN